MNGKAKLPLKVVPALEHDYYKPEFGGGGDPKVFVNVTPEYRQMLSAEVISVRDHLSSAFKQFPEVPAVARAKVRTEALAKTHRPTNLFAPTTCPIIGAEGIGHLLVSATAAGLEKLARRIETTTSKQGVANLSAIQSIQIYTPPVELPSDQAAPLKVKLFRHHFTESDEAIERWFRKILHGFDKAKAKEVRYGPGLKVYSVEHIDPRLVRSLSNFVGTQSISGFPVYRPVRTAATAVRNLVPTDFPPPNPKIEYPVIGVIDSGTPENDPFLKPWLIARDAYIPKPLQDNTHGTFVSGLIINSKQLNHGDSRFPSCGAKIVDIVALGKDGTSEEILLEVLEQTLRKYSTVKVWNLSLGTNVPIVDRRFSDFGVALDRMQDEHGVQFVLAAGNYRGKQVRVT